MPHRALLLPLVVLLVASVTFSAGPAPRSARAVGQASGVFFGAYGGSESQAMINRIDGLGVQGVRFYVEWAELEWTQAYHLPNTFIYTDALGRYDTRLQQLSAAGIKPIILIGRAPSWAAERERGPLRDGMDATFANFVRKLVLRWQGPPYNVKYWELWPEPDFGDVLTPNAPPAYETRKAWGDHPDKFTNMLKATYPVIKQADPQATVILGSLAHDAFRTSDGPGFNSGGSFVYSFLDRILDLGAGCCFDWLGFNSYSIFSFGWEQADPGNAKDIHAKANFIKGRMAAKGVQKPLISLEAGIWSCCVHYYVKPSGELASFQTDERAQAAYAAQLYARGLAADMKGVYWYLMQDEEPPTPVTDGDKHRGWYRKDLSAKPVSRTMQLLTSRLGGATFGGAYQGATVLSGEIEAYSFNHADGRSITMMWSPFSPQETARVQISGLGAIIYNIHGETVATERADGNNVRFTVGYSPVFVEQWGNLGNRSVIPNVPRNQAGG